MSTTVDRLAFTPTSLATLWSSLYFMALRLAMRLASSLGKDAMVRDVVKDVQEGLGESQEIAEVVEAEVRMFRRVLVSLRRSQKL